MFLTTYLIVKDMTASVAFYKTFLGVEPSGGCPERFAVFDIGNTSIALYNPGYDEVLIESGQDLSGHFNTAYLEDKKRPVNYGNHVILNIGVGDLAAEYNRVKRLNIGAVSEIMYVNIAMPYYFFNLYDPDGTCIEITGRYQP